MKKGRHIQTDFIKYLIEKHLDTDIDEDDIETPPKKNKRNPQIQDEDEFDEDEIPSQDETQDEDEIIEKLINEYKKVKRQYEGYRIQNRRK